MDSDVYWPAKICCVRPQDQEPTTNGPPITRTVARFIQAPDEDPLVCSSTKQCWLQLWVSSLSCTVVRRCGDCTASSATTTNVQTRLDSMFQRYLLRTAADRHAPSVERPHHIGVILSRHDDVYTALRTCVLQEKNSGVTVANLIFLEMYQLHSFTDITHHHW